MPRATLTAEEMMALEAFRKRNLEVTAFNAGLDRARELFDAWHDDASRTGVGEAETFHEAIVSERKQVKI